MACPRRDIKYFHLLFSHPHPSRSPSMNLWRPVRRFVWEPDTETPSVLLQVFFECVLPLPPTKSFLSLSSCDRSALIPTPQHTHRPLHSYTCTKSILWFIALRVRHKKICRENFSPQCWMNDDRRQKWRAHQPVLSAQILPFTDQ